MKMTTSWVSSVGTVTPSQIRQEHSSFGGRTPVLMRYKRLDSETTDMWLPANRSWLLGSIGEIIGTTTLFRSLPLGSHRNLSSEANGLKDSGNREAAEEKSRIRVQNSRGYISIYMSWLDKSGAKVLDHNSEKQKSQASLGHYL
jgi:hypothetical protein